MKMNDFDARADFFERQEAEFVEDAKSQILVGDWQAPIVLEDHTGHHECFSPADYDYTNEDKTGFTDESAQIVLAFLRKDEDAMKRAERWLNALAALAAAEASNAIAKRVI